VTYSELIAKTRNDIRHLDSFRTGCLVGIGPVSITVNGSTFKDELEAEGYLIELGYALDEIEADACKGCTGKGTFAARVCEFCDGTGFVPDSPFRESASAEAEPSPKDSEEVADG